LEVGNCATTGYDTLFILLRYVLNGGAASEPAGVRLLESVLLVCTADVVPTIFGVSSPSP